MSQTYSQEPVVVSHLPWSIRTSKHGVVSVYDAICNPVALFRDYRDAEYMLWLIKRVKEQDAEIDRLENAVEDLEDKINSKPLSKAA